MRKGLVIALNLALIFALCQWATAYIGDIRKLVDSVDPEEIRTIILDLQENADLDPPHTPHRSRFTLRVKNTNNPSDDALDNAADYLFSKLSSFGLEVEYDPFTISTANEPWGYVRRHGEGGTYEARNVIATLPGTGPNRDSVYIICAHYDSCGFNEPDWFVDENWKTMAAPGANDNASGVSALVEAARVLSDSEFDATLKFIPLAGHEVGLFGSRHYAEAARDNEDIIGVLNLDGIGYEADEMDMSVIGKERSGWMVEAVSAVAREYKINLIVDDAFSIGGDHRSFWEAGFDGVMFSYLGRDSFNQDQAIKNWGYHTPGDTMDNINMEFTSLITQLVVASATELANPLVINGVVPVEPCGKLASTWAKVKIEN